MEAIVDEFALAECRAACRWFRGWAQARMGEPQEGYRRIRDGYETNVHVGMLAGASETLGYAAEALLLAGDWNGAQAQLEEALQIVHDRGERVYLPQLLVIQAAISDARGQSAEARVWIRRAVAEARAQEAPWLELIALLALCERADATTEDRQALAAIVDSLPEALEATALARARALLDKAQPA
jgi:ATP/maltotriose-dependent transcriptional regulator MalT